MPRKVSIRDVAEAAGVSPTTVSHALNGLGNMTPETRAKVVAVAQRLNYRPNRMARSLRQDRSNVIGVINDFITTTPFAVSMLGGIHVTARERGFTVVVATSAADPTVEAEEIALLSAYPVDGLILAKMFHQPAELPQSQVPLAVANGSADDSVASFVPDDYGVGATATKALLDVGHRNIVHLSIVAPGSARDLRAQAFRDVAGPNGRVVEASEATTQAARRDIEAVLLAPDRPTAVFCFNDQMAMGVYQVAQRLGLRVPEDLSVVGVDDLELISTALEPALTTVALPHFDIGAAAVRALMAKILGEEYPRGVHRVPCRLVERGSVAPPAV